MFAEDMAVAFSHHMAALGVAKNMAGFLVSSRSDSTLGTKEI